MVAERRLTVVQLVPELDSGGVERGTVEVVRALTRAGHRSIVVCAGGRMVEELRASGGELVQWPIGRKSPLTLRFVRRLRRLLRDEDAQVVHARSRIPAWIAYLAWRRMPAGERPRFVTTVHGIYSVNRYSEIMTRGEYVIAVSETVRRHLENHYPHAESSRIRVIHRGVDLREFPHGHRPSEAWLQCWYDRFPELADKVVLTLPGRLTRLKGHQAFLDLLGRLARDEARMHGLIVGDGSGASERYASVLRREAATRGLPVTFAGHREDMRDVYAASHVVLSLSSHPESFGRTVVEALSVGVPVIGYDHGGVGEVLASAFPAGLVKPGDEQALDAKVRRFAEDPPHPPALRAFTLESMLAQTLALYAELTEASAISEPTPVAARPGG